MRPPSACRRRSRSATPLVRWTYVRGFAQKSEAISFSKRFSSADHVGWAWASTSRTRSTSCDGTIRIPTSRRAGVRIGDGNAARPDDAAERLRTLSKAHMAVNRFLSGRGRGGPGATAMAAAQPDRGARRPRSPEVHADRTVTFRLRAPSASRRRTRRRSPAGQGVASDDEGRRRRRRLTIGPLPPEIWIYNFRVQGVDLPDPANISVMPRAAGAAAISSFVEVPGDARPSTMRARCRTARCGWCCTSRRRWA